MYRASLAAFTALMLSGCIDPAAVDGMGAGQTSLGFADTAVATDAVPFGQLARNCTIRKRDMGTRVGTASGYDVYDTAPDTIQPRTHFLTGFGDGCARQFTGALVIFGDIGTHEIVRYADVGLDQPYTTTDEAYEVIKAGYCRVGRAEPCGRSINRLARTTSFVTIYDSFADNAAWMDILLHKGDVAATDVNR